MCCVMFVLVCAIGAHLTARFFFRVLLYVRSDKREQVSMFKNTLGSTGRYNSF